MKNKVVLRLSALLAAVLIFAGFSGCSKPTEGAAPAAQTPQQQEEELPLEEALPERPAIWEVTDPDSGNSIYLFGSIHAAEDVLFPMDQEIMDAFDASDALAVEVDVLPYMEDPQKAMEMAAYMIYDDGRSITDEIDEELFSRILELLKAEEVDLGVPDEMAGMFRPYTFISLLSGIGAEKAGISAEQGVDMYFIQLAREREMDVLEVESMDSQLSMFNTFSPAVQTYLLESGLNVEEAGEGVRALYAAWKIGDVDALIAAAGDDAEIDETERQAVEEYNKALITDRNLLMSDAAENYLLEGQKVFYVVGALHMVGDDGIVQQMADRGYTVNRF